jgi:hypothetical protein
MNKNEWGCVFEMSATAMIGLIILVVVFVLALTFTSAEGAAEPTPTPNGHWINPEPWPTYSSPYPAPEASPTPAPYPDDYYKAESLPFKQKHYVAEPGPEWNLWSWIWDLGSALFE